MESIGDNGYSGTDWSTCTVQEIWAKISNQTTESYWTVISGWRKSHELTGDHMITVQRYKENLIQAWPPDKNPAAEAYIARLDSLLGYLQDTYASAVANEKSLAAVAGALSDARSQIEPLAAEHAANEAALQKFKTDPEIEIRSARAITAPVPPVPDGRQDTIAAEIRNIMYATSANISSARTRVVQPERFDPTNVKGSGEKDPASSQGNPPALGPVTPFRAPAGSAPGATTGAMPTFPPGREQSGATPSTGFPGHRQPGLILGGVQAPPATLPPTTGGGPLPTTGVGSSQVPSVMIPSMPLTPGSRGSLPFGPDQAPLTGGRRVTAGPAPGGTGAGRAMAPGGVIGGQPGVGLGQPANGGRPAQRVNPPGGVINPNSQAPRGRGRASSASGSLMGNAQGCHNRRSQDPSSVSWDPNNPWETAEGVAPVIRPAKERPIDPGPAIGLK